MTMSSTSFLLSLLRDSGLSHRYMRHAFFQHLTITQQAPWRLDQNVSYTKYLLVRIIRLGVIDNASRERSAQSATYGRVLEMLGEFRSRGLGSPSMYEGI